MNNPWTEIPLSDYENHMKLDSVGQLSALSEMMQAQFAAYPARSVMILGIAGGNGLEHIRKGQFKKIYGVDVNADYLQITMQRHPELRDVLECLCVDLRAEADGLPKAELLIADLLIEYVGCACFEKIVRQVCPNYVSCIVQVNCAEYWISDSPYVQTFAGLEQIHHAVEERVLIKTMRETDYSPIGAAERVMPNGKKLLRLDFKKSI